MVFVVLLFTHLLSFLTKQIYGDPEAADVVFTSGANIDVVGINITTQVKLKGEFHRLNMSNASIFCSFNCIILFTS